MPQDAIEIQVVTSLAMVAQSDWDSCACPETGSGKDPRALDPFTTYRFLWALETSGSVGEATGWQPYFLLAFQKNGSARPAGCFGLRRWRLFHACECSWHSCRI